MHAGHGIAGCPSRSIAQLGGTITHKGGAGGWWARGVRLPPIPDGAGAVRADGSGTVQQSLPAAQPWRGQNSMFQFRECQRERDPCVWKRSQNAQQITSLVSMNPPSRPPPSSACPKTEPHRLSPSLCRWIFKGFSIVKGLLWE